MKRWKEFFWISAGILVLAVLLGGVTPHAIAQIRAALVRDMDSPIRGTLQVENETFTFATNSFSITETITPVIPAGKKLFLQAASVHTLLTDGQSPMEVRLSVAGTGVVGYVDQEFQATSSSGGQRHFTGNLDLDILLSSGQGVTMFVFRNDNQGNSSLNFTRLVLKGYLVDINP